MADCQTLVDRQILTNYNLPGQTNKFNIIVCLHLDIIYLLLFIPHNNTLFRSCGYLHIQYHKKPERKLKLSRTGTIIPTIRYGPLWRPTTSSCRGLQPMNLLALWAKKHISFCLKKSQKYQVKGKYTFLYFLKIKI